MGFPETWKPLVSAPSPTLEEAEAELTGDVLDPYDEGFRDALAQVACVHPGVDITPFTASNLVENGKIAPRVLP